MKFSVARLMTALSLAAATVVVPAIADIDSVVHADGSPDVALAKSMAPTTLYGEDIPVTLSLTNPGGPDGFNASFNDTLPVGVSYVPGSSTPEPTVIPQGDGTTVLVWSNIADSLTGSTVGISYSMHVDDAIYDVPDTITNSANAYVNSDPRILPAFNPVTGAFFPSTHTGNAAATATTELIPFTLTKAEPNAEDELLRGVHDNQTVYTLTVENNLVNPTNDFSIVDYIPAQLEFLGCGDVDNSTAAEEYTGSGPINPGNAPPLANPCPVPSSVTTVTTDPDGPGPLPSAVYTRVEWDSASLALALGSADLAATGIFMIDYIAAIPLNENVQATLADTTANLDNNTGALTTESETQIQNYAVASGFYDGGATASTDDAYEQIVIEDVSIHKGVDSGEFVQGDTPVWTLDIEASEYALSTTAITVTDTLPATVDFDGSVPVPTSGPVLNPDGTLTYTWVLPAFTAPGDTAQIVINTTVRDFYRLGDGSNGTPIASNDSYTNTTDLTTDATIIIDNTGATAVFPVTDESSASQSSGGPSILKEVGEVGPDPLNCTNGTGITFDPDFAASYRPGDRVCYRLTVDFPASLDTLNPVVTDFLPAGFAYESFEFTTAIAGGNSVPEVDVTFDASDEPALTWDLSDVDTGVRFQVVLQTIVSDPLAGTPGDLKENLMKFRYSNFAGGVFQLRDAALAEWSEPVLDLNKGVIELNGIAVSGAPADGVVIQEGDTVTYQVSVSNSGTEPALDISMRDVLPPGITCADVSGISDGGECDAANDWIQWETNDNIDLVPTASIDLTYDVLIPSGIGAGESLVNTAGVREYTGETNTGTDFTYVPGNNIDGTLTPNTDPVDDTSEIVTALPTVDKTQTTQLDEAGNAADDEATIGETVSYTVTIPLPRGVTYFNGVIEDVLDAETDLDVSSVLATVDGGALPSDMTLSTDNAANSWTITLDSPYSRPAGAAQVIVVTFDAVITDVASNTRATTSSNTANFDFENAAGDSQNVTDTVSLTIVEPDITLAKSHNDGDGVVTSGQSLTYTLDVENAAGASVSTAHETVVTDTVPPELIVDVGSISNGGVFTPGATAADPGTITWNIATINPGATVSLTYDVVTADPLISGSSLQNTADAITTSMPGVVAGERDVTSPNGDTVGDGYTDPASSTVTVPALSLTKSGNPATATVGETVTYTVDVTIPGGLIAYDVTVLDDIPVGLTYESLTSITCDEGGGACSPDIDTGDATVIDDGDVVAFFFDDLDTQAVADRVVTITYVAFVADVAAADDGATLTNGASVHWNQTDTLAGPPATPPTPGSFDSGSPVASDDVDTIEPTLTIDKDVAGQNADDDARRAKPGDTLTYTLTIANTGTSPAYDVTVSDVATDDTWAFTDTTADAGVVNSDADPVGGLEWTIAGPIPAPGSVTITYELVVPPGYDSSNEIASGPEQTNTADIPSYFGVDETTRTANPTRTFREYDDVVADTVEIELDLASIGDDVWFDVNNDGIQQASEPVMADVDVSVIYLGPDGVLGGGDDEVFAATTNASGKYVVTDLPGGEYIVDVDESDPDFITGLVPSYDLDDGTVGPDGISTATLGEDEDKRDVDFGYTGTGSIGDTIWFDQDLDGVTDPNEAGIAGVDVTVTWFGPDGVAGGGDDVVYTATTDADGMYLVENLPAGEYTVEVDPASLPTGYNNVFDPDGGNDDASALTLGVGEDNLDQDFGYAGDGTIGDYIWLDQNNDGVQDASEPGLGGVMMQLTSLGPDGILGTTDDSVFTTTTAADGSYLFENLPPGDYQVEVTGALPANVVNSYDPDVAGPGDSISSVTLTLAEPDDLDQDFGYFADSTLGDRVWWDIDDDGVQDAGEPGLNGVEVTATFLGPDGVLGTVDDEVFVTTTSGDGDYLFENIPDGDYVVAVTNGIPAGYDPTFDEDSGTASPDETTDVTLATEHLTADFGYNGSGSIGDTIWFDTNADGVLDAGEVGLEGVEVVLTWFGPDGVAGGGDDIVLTTTTDATGNYLFDGLPAGEFSVDVTEATLPAGMAATYDKDGGTGSPDSSTLVTLAAGEDIDDVDFGYNGSGSIGDTVWFDRNGDGVFDADEYLLGGVDVELVWESPNGPISFTTTTAADGTYLFPNLPPADYTVNVQTATLPPGLDPTFDADGGNDSSSALTLADGEDNLDQDFGYNGAASIGDTIYLDLDGNGTQGLGEPGVPNQDVELSWVGPDGPVTFTTTTDANGNYLFDNLPDGDFTVTVVGGIVATSDNTGDPDGGGDSTSDTPIAGGVDDLDQDFGYQGINSIGDQIWWDQNANGAFDAGEPGLENIEVTLVWFGPDGVAGGGDDITFTTTTDAAGNYLFENLPDGSYSVTVTGGLPAGLDTNTYDGDDMTVSPDGTSIVTDLGVGSATPVADLDQDFGYTGTGSIGDTIWFDANGDEVLDPGEPGIPGADVTLTWGGPDGVLGTADDVVLPTKTTGADGMYLYENLPAGPFQVDVVNPLVGTTPTADPDGGDDNTSQLTLATGEDNLDQDFGYTGTGSIGDTIWFDQNLDGVQNPGEDGIGGVDVTVTWFGPDGVAGGGDDVVYTTTTDVDGNYLVENLPAGPYSVVVDTADLPGDYTNVFDPDGGADSESLLTLADGEDNLDQDFGYAGAGTIGDTIYLDQNGDGDQDVGEPGLVGITVELVHFGPDGVLGGDDDSFFTTVTGLGGDYLFENLPEGNYEVTVTGGITLVENSDDPDLPGAPDVGDSVSTTTLTAAVPDDLDQDFGYNAISVLGDRVWWDINGDGVQDPDEPGLFGVEVQIDSPALAFPLTTTTNANGDYLFENIPNGDYTVTIISGVPAGFNQTFDASGSQSDETSTTTLVDSDLEQDFGYNGNGSIGDTIWLDTDGDGTVNGGEIGLEGIEVLLTWFGPDGVAGGDDDIILTTTTDAAGNYLFDGLPAGEFLVDVNTSTLPAGLSATFDKDGGIATPDGQTPVTLAVDENVIDVDFGYNGSGSIGDTIWFDRNGDGVFDADEYPLSGIGVTLVWDSPSGPQVFTTTTAADGTYNFPNLPPGDYTVTVTTADLPPGMAPTFDADEATNGLNSTSALTLGDGEDNVDQDFGYNGSASIGDTIYLDLDGDGVQGPGEPGVPGQAVELTWVSPDGPVTFTTTTDANGNYLFDNLPGGDYTVTVIGGVVDEAVNTGDPGGDGDSANSITLAPAEANLDQDFGYQGINSIGDQVWFDANADGVFDVGTEPGLDAVEVTLVWFGPDGAAGGGDDVTFPVDTTDPAGLYLFENLPDGSYSVTVTDGLPPGLDTNTYDGDDLTVNPDSTSIVTDLGVGLPGPADDLDQDFGYAGSGSIGDVIWLDLNGDGVVDPGEPGIPGADVTLTWAGPDGVLGTADDVVYPTQTTGTDGAYLFENLPPGPFQIDVVNPLTGVSPTADPDGGDDDTAQVTLTAGEENLDQDFGYNGNASIGDTIWLDVDKDGTQGINEPGLAGITVTVTSGGPDGIIGTADDIVIVVDTDADGMYLVEGLPPGETAVSYDVGDLGPGLVPNSDLDGGDATTTTVTLNDGDAIRDVDFGVVGDATITGVVWEDTNGDGVQDPGEPGIGGVTVDVTFDGPDGPVVLTVVTNPDGSWSLTDIPPGDYTTAVDPTTVPAGLVPSTPVDVDATVPPGGTAATSNGFVPGASIGDLVWHDTDRNGVQSPGEAGASGVTVELLDDSGTVIATTVTDTDGGYNFGGLAPGTYTVRIVTSTLPPDFSVVADPDGNNDGVNAVTIGPGEDITTVDFGIGSAADLPATGRTIIRTLMIASILLAAGWFLFGATRRRRKLL